MVRDRNKVDSTADVNAYHFDQDVSRNELAGVSLSIVDHIGFRIYSTSLQPLFRMVFRKQSRTLWASMIMKWINERIK